MTEAVDILIKADDKASQKFKDAAVQIDKSAKRVEQILTGLEDPAERYNKQLQELAQLHKDGALTAEQFAQAEEKLAAKIKGNSNSFKELGGNAKRTTEFVGVLAQLTGSAELASFAGQMASATEKVSSFSDVAKEGGAGATAFKFGLMGLAAAIGAGIGKFIGDIVFQTEKWGRAMEAAKTQAQDLDAALRAMSSTTLATKFEDIEIIRDPKEKQAAYESLTQSLSREISIISGRLAKQTAEVEAWDNSWKITGNQKAFAEQAKAGLDATRQQLTLLQEQAAAVERVAGARAKEREATIKANEAKYRSESFLQTLRDEIQLLRATREEQIKIEALRNATPEDRQAAEQLLRVRDAIMAQKQAIEERERIRQKAADDAARAAEKAQQDAERETQRVEDLVTAEQERLALQRIELELGKEAARAQDLINRGVDEYTAKQLASEEASIEMLRKRKEEEDKAKDADQIKASPDAPALQASQSRLLTRGSGLQIMDETNRIMTAVREEIANMAKNAAEQLAETKQIKTNTASSVTVKAVT